jgi:hypothetical protein
MEIQQQKIEVQQQNYWMFHNQHGNLTIVLSGSPQVSGF